MRKEWTSNGTIREVPETRDEKIAQLIAIIFGGITVILITVVAPVVCIYLFVEAITH